MSLCWACSILHTFQLLLFLASVSRLKAKFGSLGLCVLTNILEPTLIPGKTATRNSATEVWSRLVDVKETLLLQLAVNWRSFLKLFSAGIWLIAPVVWWHSATCYSAIKPISIAAVLINRCTDELSPGLLLKHLIFICIPSIFMLLSLKK